jgi:hypothetical protein
VTARETFQWLAAQHVDAVSISAPVSVQDVEKILGKDNDWRKRVRGVMVAVQMNDTINVSIARALDELF